MRIICRVLPGVGCGSFCGVTGCSPAFLDASPVVTVCDVACEAGGLGWCGENYCV